MILTAVQEATAEQRPRYSDYKDTGIEHLGRIPSHWATARLKNIVHINPEVLPETTDPGYRFTYIDIGSVTAGEVSQDADMISFEGAPSRARRIVRAGDTYISTVRTYLRAIGFVEDNVDDLIVSTGFAVLRPGPNTYPPFLYRLVDSTEFVDAVVAHSVGVGYPAISPSILATLPVWLPPLDEQRAIAGFLDRETAQIDALIAKKERLIELLQEKRAALISHAVTKGLDPTAPTRDSGIPWIGHIPAHWEETRLGYVSRSLQTGPFGSQLHAEEYVDGGVPVINPAHLTPDGIKPDYQVSVDMDTANRLLRHRLLAGDIVFARRGELGRCSLVTPKQVGWLCGTGSLRVRPDDGLVDSSYLFQYLSIEGVADWLSLQSVGSTMDNLNTSILARLPVVKPPIQEQIAIRDWITEQRMQISTLIDKVRDHIELLREHRTALISTAVTGKIDVRGEA